MQKGWILNATALTYSIEYLQLFFEDTRAVSIREQDLNFGLCLTVILSHYEMTEQKMTDGS